MNQHRAQVAITALADAQPPLLAPGAVLLGRESQRSGHLPTVGKLPRYRLVALQLGVGLRSARRLHHLEPVGRGHQDLRQ